MMSEQLVLKLPRAVALGYSDYFVSKPNQYAFDTIMNWQKWNNQQLLLVGDEGAGKTHLAHVWAEQTGAYFYKLSDLFDVNIEDVKDKKFLIIEDIEHASKEEEVRLFHIYNEMAVHNNHLLLTTASNQFVQYFTLPDLVSRLSSMMQVKLSEVDDLLLSAILMKQFSDRQLQVSPLVIDYTINRIERSFATVHALVQFLDERSLEDQKSITRSWVSKQLEKFNKIRD